MLRRMYLKWFDKKEFSYEIISEHRGEEAGIKSSILKVTGINLYGLMKNESGVHRLVRISPFDSGARRHTSFASIWVYPVVDDNISIEISENDLRIDTYRSSGAGGQHVNTTDSAVRITHLPTKIVVQCQNERSQHKNKDTCFKMLKARLFEHEIQKREKENLKESSLKTDIGVIEQANEKISLEMDYKIRYKVILQQIKDNIKESKISITLTKGSKLIWDSNEYDIDEYEI